jgi:hypothetical protein
MHCHLDIHQSWGLGTAFIVKNGKGEVETLPPLRQTSPGVSFLLDSSELTLMSCLHVILVFKQGFF